MTFLEFWGKAGKREDGDFSWHPIAYHCLDVAACVQRVLTVRPLARGKASRLFRSDATLVIPVLTALAAIHDIGKFANCFQAKRPDLWPAVLGEMPSEIANTYHTRDGFGLWSGSLRERLGSLVWRGDGHSFKPAVQAAMGHHGRPVSIDPRRDVLGSIFHAAGRSAAEAFAEVAVRLLVSQPLPAEHLRERDLLRASWWIAGLITTADWIGSHEEWFPYCAPSGDDPDLASYWAQATDRAAAAIRHAGLEPPRTAPRRTFQELTGHERPPTPAQDWASTVALPDGPALFVLEDATGSGKTEAAQILVHRLMAAGRASGAFWAMPTQATANAMYDRQSGCILALFDSHSGSRPSLVLAHGQSRMHQGFRATVILEPGADRSSEDAVGDDVPGEIACAAFFANSSRTALMADVGAGTVDQAMLAVLPSKFNTMRLFGLAEKVLVLDEIHAYDSYMIEQLKALLRFHAELGGSVIVLSATLSSTLASGLIDEWRYATTRSAHALPEIKTCKDYPLATVVGGDGTVARSRIELSEWSRRIAPVTLIHDADHAVQILLDASRAGAAAVWIRNTVDSCCEGAALLRSRGAGRVSVFHARFAQVDRQRRERDVLERFGRKSDMERVGSILVATQVVEQSLDLDFDVMVSDLAPIDLLIQRAGRLHRHPFRSRPSLVDVPMLHVLAPQFDESPGSAWLDTVLPKTRWVYQDSGIMWRTLRALHSRREIATPDGLRELIALVYDDDECPENLAASADRARGEAAAAVGTARQYSLNMLDGYVGESLLWLSDIRVPTRLNDHQTTIRLGRILPDQSIEPWAQDGIEALPEWHRWALSEVKVSRHRLPRESQTEFRYRHACDTVRSKWGRWEQEIPLVPMRQDKDNWVAEVVTKNGRPVALHYEADFGLLVSVVPGWYGSRPAH